MNNQNQNNQVVARIQKQQSINTVEPTNQNPTSTLDERIQKMKTTAALARILGKARQSAQPLPQSDNTTSQAKASTSHISHPTPTEKPTTSQLKLPILQLPKKSKISFIQRFRAYHANSQKPEYQKVASTPCEQNENISFYMFKDKERAYKAAKEQGTNQYKYGGGRLVSYYNTVEKVPNKAKFTNEYQKQVWIHMLETVGTYNLYALMGKFDEEENILLHNANHSIEVYVTGLQGPIPMASGRSLQAFGLKERTRNLIIQTFEKRTIIVIEAIIPWSEIRRTPEDIDLCTNIEKAIVGQQGYKFKPHVTPELPKDIIFIAAIGCYDETIMQEHLVEVTIMGYQGNTILSTIIAPRLFVTINSQHLGFEEDDLTSGKDEITTMKEIRKLVRNKIIITYNVKKVMRLCGIFTGTIQGYIDLERYELLRRQCGIFTNQIKLIQMAKKLNIKTRHPMRTAQRCHIYKQLWKKVEPESTEIMRINYNYPEEDVIELQNRMEDEFTSIGKTPQHLPRNLIKGTKSPERRNTNPTTTISKPPTLFSIDTSPMKRLKLTTNEDMVNIPLLSTIKRKCRTQKSNIPSICLINGEEYQIQAIIANPLHEPKQTIICQTSKSNDSQGREISKGGRYVRDLQREDSQREDSENSG